MKNKIFKKENIIKMIGSSLTNTFVFTIISYVWFKNGGIPTNLDNINISTIIIIFIPILFIIFFLLRLSEEFLYPNNKRK